MLFLPGACSTPRRPSILCRHPVLFEISTKKNLNVADIYPRCDRKVIPIRVWQSRFCGRLDRRRQQRRNAREESLDLTIRRRQRRDFPIYPASGSSRHPEQRSICNCALWTLPSFPHVTQCPEDLGRARRIITERPARVDASNFEKLAPSERHRTRKSGRCTPRTNSDIPRM